MKYPHDHSKDIAKYRYVSPPKHGRNSVQPKRKNRSNLPTLVEAWIIGLLLYGSMALGLWNFIIEFLQ